MSDWKDVYKHGMLVIQPDKETCQIVNKLRSQHDPESQSFFGAHITLTQPFLEEPDQETWQELGKKLSQFKSFQIQYGPVNTFPETPVVKFEIEPKESILSIRKALHDTGFFNLSLPFTEGFIPHMTISDHALETAAEALSLAQKLEKETKSSNFHCQEIAYIKPDSDFHFNIKKKLI